MEEIENIKDFNFLRLYLVRRLKKWKDEKNFCLINKKSEKMKNVIYIYIYINK